MAIAVATGFPVGDERGYVHPGNDKIYYYLETTNTFCVGDMSDELRDQYGDAETVLYDLEAAPMLRFVFFPDENHFITRPQNARFWWNTNHAWLTEHLSSAGRQ